MMTSTYPAQRATGPVPPPPNQSTWGVGRIAALLIGIFMLLSSLALAFGGISLAVAASTLRDDDGYLMSGDATFSTATYAMTTQNMEIHAEGAAESVPRALLGDAKVTAAPNGDAPVFVGVAPTADVRAYLDEVGHATVIGLENEDPTFRITEGVSPAEPPTETDIWVAQSSGEGTQSVTWPVENGDWTVVVMNADGSRGVSADVAAGATVPALGWVATGILVCAAVGLALAILVIVLALRAGRRPVAM